jgi:polyamine oxidase
MAVRSYDDGSADVPAGLTGRVERVVVVGAGIAGLTVANALGHGGVDCVVLEARDRIGGRLHTVDLAGSPLDLGGSWIHHPIGNPLRSFAEGAGIGFGSGDPLPELGGYDCGDRRRLSRAEVEDHLALLYDAFPQAVDRLRTELGPGDAPVSRAIDSFVEGTEWEPAQARLARQGLRAVIEAESADLSERQSLRWMWNEVEYGGGYFGDLPVGGYRLVVAEMAAGVQVRTGAEVARVDVSTGVARLTCTDGTVESGSHVVVTVPLGVLKRRVPEFSPELPQERIDAIQRLGFGRFEKVAVRFDQPFWRAAGVSHMMLFPPEPAESTVWMMDLAAFGAGPTLVFLIFHSAAGHVLDATAPEEAAAWALSLLAGAVGGSCPDPVAVAVSSWANDPFTGGAYTHIPPGAQAADVDLLGEPFEGLILFAGEHTQSARLAYADGAMSSGIREAKRLLGVPAVQLGRHGIRTV